MTHGADSAAVRSQLLIANTVQATILQRIVFYTLACAVYFIVVIFCVEASFYDGEPWTATAMRCLDVAIFWAPGLMLLIPVVVHDLLTLNRRITGPMHRLRGEMKRLIHGESESPLAFRDDDDWFEVADDFNRLREEVIDLRQQVASAETSETGSRPQLFEQASAAEPAPATG